MAQEIWTIGRILKWTEQYFADKGMDSPRLDAEVLLSHVLGKERIYLYVHFDEPLEQAELAAYRGLVKRRVQHEPVAYLVGSREFMGLDFRVTPDVLIPRPDTEILAQEAIERLRAMPGEKRVADLGTGSGAICLSVLHYVPEAEAWGTDISEAAAKVAEANAEALGLAGRARFHAGDLFAPLAGMRFHAILSNPPYIPDGELASLPPDVQREPRRALAGGADGLDFYRRILAEAAGFLAPGGFLALEVGIRQAEAVQGLAEAAGALRYAGTRKDLAGIDRVAIAEMP